jgi:hypothetical protein
MYAEPLLQVPPGVAQDKDVVAPGQIGPPLPVIAAGAGFTVTVIVESTEDCMQEIIAVPAETPVTIAQEVPVDATVATATLLLLHVAAVVIVVSPHKYLGVPIHTRPEPEIAAEACPVKSTANKREKIKNVFFILVTFRFC